MGDVTFLSQAEPVDEYGRALYAVARPSSAPSWTNWEKMILPI
jgi:hypothetical protein